jgi:hypothetical protein
VEIIGRLSNDNPHKSHGQDESLKVTTWRYCSASHDTKGRWRDGPSTCAQPRSPTRLLSE